MKPKLTKFERKMKHATKVYGQMREELGLTGDTVEQMHKLVESGCELMNEIYKYDNLIKVEGFDKAVMITPIDKPTWSEFIAMTAKKNLGKLSEKQMAKFESNCETRRFISNLRQSFYDTYLSDETLKIVDEDSLQDYNFDNIEENEFTQLLEEYSKFKDYIISLNKSMGKLAECAFYISNGKVNKKDFKNLVEWEFYKDSEDPKQPSKSWELYGKFAKMVNLMTDYEFDQINDLSKEFGIKYEFHTPQITMHPWNTDDEDDELD